MKRKAVFDMAWILLLCIFCYAWYDHQRTKQYDNPWRNEYPTDKRGDRYAGGYNHYAGRNR